MEFAPDDREDNPVNLYLTSGALFLQFAKLESILALELRTHLVGRLSERNLSAYKLAGAVYGSARFSSSRDTIKRLAADEGQPPQKLRFMSDLFDHLGHIANLRDKLAHHHVRWSGRREVWLVSDLVTTRRIAEYKTYEFHTLIVGEAVLDLHWATSHLSKLRLLETRKFGPYDLRQPPWQYKPSSLKLIRRKSGSRHEEHPPPLEPYQE